MILVCHTDDQLRAMDCPEAVRELAKRGLVSTPETIAKLKADRLNYKRHASNAEGGWGYTARRRFSR